MIRCCSLVLHNKGLQAGVGLEMREDAFFSLRNWPLGIWPCSSDYIDNTNCTFYSLPFGGRTDRRVGSEPERTGKYIRVSGVP